MVTWMRVENVRRGLAHTTRSESKGQKPMRTMGIFKDKIVLKWDGSIPEDLIERLGMQGLFGDEETRRRLLANEFADLFEYWSHIGDYLRFSKKSGNFTCSFSYHNLARLHREFGPMQVLYGQPDIDALKRRLAKFRAMAERLKSILAGNLDPTIQFKVPPLGHYQLLGVNGLAAVERFPLFADCGMGKTYMVLVSSEHHLRTGLVRPGKMLVCGELPRLRSGWYRDAVKFTDLKPAILWSEGAKKRAEVLRLMQSDADIFIINLEGCKVYLRELVEMGFEKVVVDESTILKSYRGDFAKRGGVLGRCLLQIAAR